ncbi:MAG TPA: DUF4184 family protein [Thermoplasmata archaeon]|nr:DUF4184 family protein [Thermoplasmata archaeon]
MPFTPFHVIAVWPLYTRWPKRWDLLALSFGSVMSDLEVITVYPIFQTWESGRGIMHSLLGVFTMNLLLAVLAARYLAPWLATRLDRRFPGKGWRLFAGHDVVNDRKSWPVTIGSAIFGGLTHLGLDLFMHVDTPIFWPWRTEYIRALPFEIVVNPVWNIGIEIVVAIPFFWMLWRWVGK